MIRLQIIDRTGHTELLERSASAPADPGTLTREEIEEKFQEMVGTGAAFAGSDTSALEQVTEFGQIPAGQDVTVLIVGPFQGG